MLGKPFVSLNRLHDIMIVEHALDLEVPNQQSASKLMPSGLV